MGDHDRYAIQRGSRCEPRKDELRDLREAMIPSKLAERKTSRFGRAIAWMSDRHGVTSTNTRRLTGGVNRRRSLRDPSPPNAMLFPALDSM